MSYYDDDVFADGDYDLGDDDYRDYLARANSGREDDYDKYALSKQILGEMFLMDVMTEFSESSLAMMKITKILNSIIMLNKFVTFIILKSLLFKMKKMINHYWKD